MIEAVPDRKSIILDSRYTQGLVSVIVPSYQSKDTIAETIESILSQSYQEIEIVVVDDGSTDDTFQYLTEIFGEKIILLRQENKGLSSARNTGLSISKGEFIQFLDADDLIYPNKIKLQVEFFRDNFCVDIVNSLYEILESGKKKLPREYEYDGIYTEVSFVVGNPVGAVFSPLIRRRVVVSLGGFDESFDNYCADWDFWMTAFYRGFKFENISETLGAYRSSPQGLTQSSKLPNKLGDLHVQRRWAMYYPEKISSYVFKRYLCISFFDAGLYAANEKGRNHAIKLMLEAVRYAPFKLKLFLICACLLALITPKYVLEKRESISRLRTAF